MADVLLVNPSVVRRPAPAHVAPPLAPMQLAAVLRRAGHAVEILDGTFARGPDEVEARLSRSAMPRVAGVYAEEPSREAALAAIALLKEHGVRVFAFGPDAAARDADYLFGDADVVIRADAGAAILELLDAFGVRPHASAKVPGARPTDARLRAIPGIAFIDGDVNHCRSEDGAPAASATPAPLPAYDLVDVERYLAEQRRSSGRASLPVAITRGPEGAAEELLLLYERYGVERVRLDGAPDAAWLRAFSRASRGLRVCWECRSRAEVLDRALIEEMSLAGACRVVLPIELGAADALARVAGDLHRLGISMAGELALGDDPSPAIALVRRLAPIDVRVTSGSRLAEALLRAEYELGIEDRRRTRVLVRLLRVAHALAGIELRHTRLEGVLQ